MAWGRAPADQSTGVILLGSKQGCIYEGIIKASEDFFKKEDRFFKQLFTIGNGLLPVFGIHYEKFPAYSNRYLVLVVTSQSIYQFIGDVAEDLQERGVLSFINLFHYYDTNPGTCAEDMNVNWS